MQCSEESLHLVGRGGEGLRSKCFGIDHAAIVGAHPAAAQLPGPVLQWTSTVLVLSALAAVGLLGLRLFSGVAGGSSRAGAARREPIDRRRRLGVPTQAAFDHPTARASARPLS